MSKKEIIHVLSEMKQEKKMKYFLMNLTNEGREEFFNLLSFLEESQQEKWMNVYEQL